MKVSTDACIFGAWITIPNLAENCLEIGTGTGLLSLMLAQRFKDISMDTVEINEEAVLQATQNIEASKFANQIKIHHADIKNFEKNRKYDFIFSNPPFFENDVISENTAINLAKHSSALTLQELMIHCKRLLHNEGVVAIIIPTHRSQDLQKFALENDLHIKEIVRIRHNVNKQFAKEIHVYSCKSCKVKIHDFTIKNIDNLNSEMMKNLMMQYYL
jgi:tRNA1Val (adenine37-N6)-methyltransferase